MCGDESAYRTVKGVTQKCQAKCTWDGWLSFDYVLFFPKKQGSIFQIFQDLDLVQENFSKERFRWICCYGIRQMLPLRSLRIYRFSFSQGACGVDFSIPLLGSQRIPKALMDFGCWSLSLQEMDLPMLRRWMLTMRRGSQRNVSIWTNHWPNLANHSSIFGGEGGKGQLQINQLYCKSFIIV